MLPFIPPVRTSVGMRQTAMFSASEQRAEGEAYRRYGIACSERHARHAV
jgi:hypothetical protein